ncbi:MAG: tRNA 2-selenouridine(34) synthase MnmH [Spirochaetes bacterium]|nr:tRNA 2-selenouridine(34) synthase MnmH [Spirochaetota bacterium]
MPQQDIDITDFFSLSKTIPVIDVRSPIEFHKGHIPGSINLPLFSNEEREQIGKVYQNQGPDIAIQLGQNFAQPKIPYYLKSAKKITQNGSLIVTCYRGGLRSRRFTDLLDEHGFTIHRLLGGYKSYRKEVTQIFHLTYPFFILGGKTGSGKTEILNNLTKLDEQIIDLERLAGHRGSVFGALGEQSQPTTEQFENHLHQKLSAFNRAKRIWLEDESHRIGNVFLPHPFYQQMRSAPMIMIELDKKLRAQRLCREYSKKNDPLLIDGIKKITPRLGGLRANQAIEAIQQKNYLEAALLILDYYDKSYQNCLTKKINKNISYLQLDEDNPFQTASILKQPEAATKINQT